MISQALKSIITDNEEVMALIGSDDLVFAERGSGHQYVVIVDNGKSRVVDTIREIKQSEIQVLISGYPVLTGEQIGGQMIELIEKTVGQTLTSGKYSYHIMETIVKNDPVLIEWSDMSGFSLNMTVFYREMLI